MHNKDDIFHGLTPLKVEDIQAIDLSSFNNMNSTIDDLEPITINLSGGGGGSMYDNTFTNSNITLSGTSVYSTTGGFTITPSTLPTSVWANTYSNIPAMTASNGVTTMTQDVEIKGNLKVAGKDIGSLLEKIEERLAIYHPEPELEEKWSELRELAKRYKELAADIKEKEQIWAILKK